MTLFLLSAAIALLLFVLVVGLRERRLRQRSLLLRDILDLADALERELLECRARLREIPALTVNLPPSQQLSARATLGAEPQVQDALRDLLAHRLWLQAHAAQAGMAELQSARDALLATRAALAAQLARLADVRADFVQTRTPQ